MNLVDLPTIKNIGSIAERLRDLATLIEEGQFGDAHTLAWVIDCGNGRCEVGFLGRAAGIAGSEAHLLLAIGQRMLEAGAQEPQ